MEAVVSQSKRKMWVLLNYLALVVLIALFYTAGETGFTGAVWVGGGAALLLIIVSFVKAYVQTGLWRFVHTRVDRLDEREMLVTYESLRLSYAAFAVTCLLAFLLSELARDSLFGGLKASLIPVVAALIYLAHILPASVIAWTERDIYRR